MDLGAATPRTTALDSHPVLVHGQQIGGAASRPLLQRFYGQQLSRFGSQWALSTPQSSFGRRIFQWWSVRFLSGWRSLRNRDGKWQRTKNWRRVTAVSDHRRRQLGVNSSNFASSGPDQAGKLRRLAETRNALEPATTSENHFRANAFLCQMDALISSERPWVHEVRDR